MVGTNYCPFDGVKDVEAFAREKLKENEIETKENSRLTFCIRYCPNRNC